MFGLKPGTTPALWARVVQYYATNYRSFDMELHSHPAWEVMLVVSGTAHISWLKPNGTAVYRVLHEGDFVVLDCDISHRLQVLPGSPCRMLNVELIPAPPEKLFSFENLFGKEYGIFGAQVLCAYDREACLHSIIISLQQQLRRDNNTAGAEVNWILGQLILTVSRSYSEKAAPIRDPYVTNAENYIALHFDEDLSIEKIALHTGISRAYLQRLYKAYTGCSMVETINRMRIEKAKFLLRSSSLSVMDIAINAGFNNRQHFTEVFRRLTGLSPGAFKRQAGASAAPSRLYSAPADHSAPSIVLYGAKNTEPL